MACSHDPAQAHPYPRLMFFLFVASLFCFPVLWLEFLYYSLRRRLMMRSSLLFSGVFVMNFAYFGD